MQLNDNTAQLHVLAVEVYNNSPKHLCICYHHVEMFVTLLKYSGLTDGG